MKTHRFYIIILGLLVSFLISIRSSDVGKDTETYITHFEDAKNTSSVMDEGYELGFSILMYYTAKSTGSVTLFFFIIAGFITLSYLFLFSKIYGQLNNKSPSLNEYSIILTLLLLSSWYYAMTTNGIRQGLSLSSMYISLYYLVFEDKKLRALFFYLIALSFHNSAFLIIPLIAIYKLPLSSIFILWALTGLGYSTGVNEMMIESISSYLKIPLYDFIKSYGILKNSSGKAPYTGFDVRFFFYTIFWPILSIISIKYHLRLKKINQINMNKFYLIIKLYLILSIPYFVLGFGGYSNRYAVLAWFLIPLVQYSIINLKIITVRLKNIEFSSLLVAILIFCFIQLKWIKHIGG